MRKFFAILLACSILFAVSLAALAADGDEGGTPTTNTGSITIKDATNVSVAGKTFNAYKILDATFGANGATAYQVPTEMKSFYTTRYSTLTGNEPNFGQLVAEKVAAETDMFAFATAALAAAKTAYTTPTGTATAGENATSVTISNLAAGYYVVEDAGTKTPISALMLDTVNNANVDITIKADKPSIEKVITDADSDNGQAGEGTAQDVGSVVHFQLNSKVPDMTGYTKYTYTVHDTLSEGLTFNNDVVVKIGETTLTAGTDYTVTQNGQSFDIVFNNFINHKNQAGQAITITYSATINEHALTTNVETNKVNLEYSNNPNDDSKTEKTPDDIVYVYDFDIVIDKYAFNKDNESNHDTKLAGAEFVLYKKVTENETETTKYYKWNDTAKKVEWVDSESDATKVTTDNQGKATFQGLDSGTYYLHETKAPDGYNMLAEDVEVKITATYGTDGQITESSASCTGTGQYTQTQPIANKTGSELPSTGGVGTTIFYVVGGLLVAVALVLLITKKRMSSDEK